MVPALVRAALGATATYDRPPPGCTVLAVLWHLGARDAALLCSQSFALHQGNIELIALRTSELHEFLLSLQHYLLGGPLMLTKISYTEY